MSHEDVLATADIFRTYYTAAEFIELAELFNCNLEQYPDARPESWLPVLKTLCAKRNFSDIQSFLETALSGAQRRSVETSSSTMKYEEEKRIHHNELWTKAGDILTALRDSTIPTEVSVAEAKEFSAKSEMRDFFQKAETDILIVDPYVGVGTLDCLRDLAKGIKCRLLAGQNPGSLQAGFELSLEAFRKEGHEIEVRTHAKIHDRHAVFNERCWLIGSSLKDAGKKRFNMIEMSDTAAVVIVFLEQQWSEGTAFP